MSNAITVLPWRSNDFMIGKTVSIHSNLVKKCISFKHGSEPVRHFVDCVLVLSDARFSCPPKGHENARKVRSVYARIKGTLATAEMPPKSQLMQVRLNPKERPQLNYFHTIELGPTRQTVEVRKITKAPLVWIEHKTGTAPTAWIRRADAESGLCT